MWKKGGGRFAGVPGRSVATLMNGNVMFNINSPFFLSQKNKVKLSRLDFFFSRFQPSGGGVFSCLVCKVKHDLRF